MRSLLAQSQLAIPRTLSAAMQERGPMLQEDLPSLPFPTFLGLADQKIVPLVSCPKLIILLKLGKNRKGKARGIPILDVFILKASQLFLFLPVIGKFLAFFSFLVIQLPILSHFTAIIKKKSNHYELVASDKLPMYLVKMNCLLKRNPS